MATLSRHIKTYSDGSYTIEQVEPEPPPDLVYPDDYELAWIKPDWLLDEFSYDIRSNNLTDRGQGTPNVHRFGEMGPRLVYHNYTGRTIFSKEKQEFAADVLAVKRYGKKLNELPPEQDAHIRKVFGALYSGGLFITNKAGVDICKDYINNVNLDKDDSKIDPFACSTNTVAVRRIDDTWVRIWGYEASESLPEVTPELVATDPRLLKASIIYPRKETTFPNEKGIVYPNHLGYAYPVGKFPTYQDDSYTDVLYPMFLPKLTNGFYPAQYLHFYSDGEGIRLPYNPPR